VSYFIPPSSSRGRVKEGKKKSALEKKKKEKEHEKKLPSLLSFPRGEGKKGEVKRTLPQEPTHKFLPPDQSHPEERKKKKGGGTKKSNARVRKSAISFRLWKRGRERGY